MVDNQIKEDELNEMLRKNFSLCIKEKISRDEYNNRYEEIVKIADQFGIPHSNGQREDNRDHFGFHKSVYNKTIAENHSFEQYFRSILVRKGWNVHIVFLDPKGHDGFPTLRAQDAPDYEIFFNRCSSPLFKLKLDSKTTRFRNLICIKKNNILTYARHKAAIFITTKLFAFYISPKIVQELKKCKGKVHRNPYDKSPLFGGKCSVEISDRPDAEIRLSTLLRDKRIEKWKKTDLNPIWIGPLKELNEPLK